MARAITRGERRGWNSLFYPETGHGVEPEYIKPVLKNPRNLQSFIAETDIDAFCCGRSIAELETLGHRGAINWIRRFENVTTMRNGKVTKIADILKQAGKQWYEMSDDNKVRFVTALNPDRRLFVSKFQKPTFTDQRFTCMRMRTDAGDVSPDICHALLNSVLGMFFIEAVGFVRGLGVLDTSSTNFKGTYILNPKLLSAAQKTNILEMFSVVTSRKVYNVDVKLSRDDRRDFDSTVLQAYGIDRYYEHIKKYLMSMRDVRHSI